MSKTTKAQAKNIYDKFFGVLRCFNGGTREENERMSAHCWERLQAVAAEAKELAANPNKHLQNDSWLMEALNETIPARLQSYFERYIKEDETHSNIIQFPS